MEEQFVYMSSRHRDMPGAKLGGGHRWVIHGFFSCSNRGPQAELQTGFPGCKLGREWAGLAYTTLITIEWKGL